MYNYISLTTHRENGNEQWTAHKKKYYLHSFGMWTNWKPKISIANRCMEMMKTAFIIFNYISCCFFGFAFFFFLNFKITKSHIERLLRWNRYTIRNRIKNNYTIITKSANKKKQQQLQIIVMRHGTNWARKNWNAIALSLSECLRVQYMNRLK